VITSPTGAAIRDFLEVLRRRWRGSQVLVIPSRVQGAEAVGEIVQAIRVAHRIRPRPDVLVLTRGGGSLEDLWCFNDEQVVRQIFAAEIPVISAIGHEIDVTLADLVADVRALTPSEAAERVAPAQDDVRDQLQGLGRLLALCLQRRWQSARARLDALAQRSVFTRPHQGIQDRSHRLDDLAERLSRAVRVRWAQTQDQIGTLAGRLNALSPLAVLGRGYSLTERLADGSLIVSSRQLSQDEEILTRLGQGRVISRVSRTLDDPLPAEDQRIEAKGPDNDRKGNDLS
jgi:exodeoxyribonuclease VII large subunit